MKTTHYWCSFSALFRLRDKGLALFWVFLFPIISCAAVITVPGSYTTIQAALDHAVNGDEIIVSAGTYIENISFAGKNVTVRSTDPANASVVANTIIDGNNVGSVVSFSGAEGSGCALSGFTIRNGRASSGGGVKGNGTHAVIQYCGISMNTAQGSYPNGIGGGLVDCNGSIAYNTISGNVADSYGGGLWNCDGTIHENTVGGNTTGGSGGGLGYCDGTIHDNTISGNSASGAGGGFAWCDGRIHHNAISGNTSSYGGGLVFCDGPIYNNTITSNLTSNDGGGLYGCDGHIRNNTICGNSAEYAGGLHGCDGVIEGNMICDNAAQYDGGGFDYCGGTIQNNVISGNWALGGGGLNSCSGVIQNNTIYGNSSSQYGGGLDSCSGTVINCIIWQNTAPTGAQVNGSSTPSYSCIQAWSGGGTGNITSDPQLVDPGGGDYHLGAASPCIDAGGAVSGVARDFEGQPRPWDGTSAPRGDGSDFDIGADEYIPGGQPTPTPTPAAPPVITVPGDYGMIQAAIIAAAYGDEIIVSPATYHEKINFMGKNIILRSTDATNAAIVASTIIEGSGLGSVVTFSGVEPASCVLSGFTITNGDADKGGGICGSMATSRTGASIQNNVISGNIASKGGGIALCNGTVQNNSIGANTAYSEGGGLWECDGIIRNNIVSGNSGQYGGGLRYCDGTVQSNAIYGNSATDYGGGFCYCDGTIQNNNIYDNTSPDGAGLFGCDGSIQNNTIWGNAAGNAGGGIRYCSGTIINCVIWQNTAPSGAQLADCVTPSYSCVEDWAGGGIGNISDDPRFVDAAHGDFHLRATSPCIDAGCYIGGVTQDFEGDPRPVDGSSEARGDGSDFDIGADEYVPAPTAVSDDIWVLY